MPSSHLLVLYSNHKMISSMPLFSYHPHTRTRTHSITHSLTLFTFVIVDVILQVNFAVICKEVSEAVLEVMSDLSRLEMPAFTSTADLEASQLLRWAQDTTATETQVRWSVDAALKSTKYLEAVRAAYQAAFDSDPQLKRLATCQDFLLRDQGKLSDRVTEALLEAKPIVDELTRGSMAQLLYSSHSKIFATLRTRVSRCITKHVIDYVMTKPIVLPHSFRFTEDRSTAQYRADLMQKLANFDMAASRIRNIDQEFTADNYGEKALQSLLDAAKALEPIESVDSEDAFPLQPVLISTAAAALYDDLDMQQSGSPAFSQSAQVHAELEEIPVSPVASDLSFVNVL